jgi:hypothetical protein
MRQNSSNPGGVIVCAEFDQSTGTALGSGCEVVLVMLCPLRIIIPEFASFHRPSRVKLR